MPAKHRRKTARPRAVFAAVVALALVLVDEIRDRLQWWRLAAKVGKPVTSPRIGATPSGAPE
jgi:hypothetical protein